MLLYGAMLAIAVTSFPLNFPPYGHSGTCAPPTSLLSTAEVPQPLVGAMRARRRPESCQSAGDALAPTALLHHRLRPPKLPRGPTLALALL